MTTETVEQPSAPTEEVETQPQEANSATDSDGNDSPPELEADDAALQQSHNQVEKAMVVT